MRVRVIVTPGMERNGYTEVFRGSMTDPVRVLLVDDSEFAREVIEHHLDAVQTASFALDWRDNYEDAWRPCWPASTT